MNALLRDLFSRPKRPLRPQVQVLPVFSWLLLLRLHLWNESLSDAHPASAQFNGVPYNPVNLLKPWAVLPDPSARGPLNTRGPRPDFLAETPNDYFQRANPRYTPTPILLFSLPRFFPLSNAFRLQSS